MDAEKLSQFRNAVMNISESSPRETWEAVKRLLDELYKDRFETFKKEPLELPYYDGSNFLNAR